AADEAEFTVTGSRNANVVRVDGFSRLARPVIEEYVNGAIAAKADVVCREMTVPEAKAKGAIGLFENKYGEKVKVYTMGEFSCEICGGPHAGRTGELGTFKIKKEEASSSGVRRIKAVLE
ncbi:MAG: hypothetical protein J6P98_05795, partial [Clostridia bacterium]|nr:hypothetical protein [Clostridia bacterium]